MPPDVMKPAPCFRPTGTVYGVLLNFQREWAQWAPRMGEAPYQAAPKAPVLYVKSDNTLAGAGEALLLQDGIEAVELGATLGLVMGPQGRVDSLALLADWSVPHASYFRPAIRHRCRDGYLSLPQAVTACGDLSELPRLTLTVRRNGAVVQTVSLQDLVRGVPQLLADVSSFMTLQVGDVLMVGSDVLADGSRPLFRAGDHLRLEAPGLCPVEVSVKGEGA